MFKFNFKLDDSAEDVIAFSTESSQIKEAEKSAGVGPNEWYDSEVVDVTDDVLEIIDVCKLNSIQKEFGNVVVRYMVSGFLLEDIMENGNQKLDIKKAEERHTDLIPAVYEGGAKIWECTDDLLIYLAENLETSAWEGKSVLDLGCGSGLLGIFAFKNGAKITFQDYNKDVLEKITIPNVILNVDTEDDSERTHIIERVKEKMRFYSGDWEKWCKLSANDEMYDFILTSETIYNPENQQKLLNCMHEKLKANGKIFVAAKTHYFGVGGGLRQFEVKIKNDRKLEYKSLWISTNGVNREIIQLTKIKS